MNWVFGLIALIAVAACGPCIALPGPRSAAAETVVLGDYDAELRRGEHVDIERMVERLSELGANTYMWLVWHSRHDWDDLHAFLPLAERAGIDVWVYLVPHSETALQDPQWPYSEPFKVDYVRWAEEIARLSLAHKNLAGYVIDDFWANVRPGRFTPDYTRKMVLAGKAINPQLKFYPLMYFREFGVEFVEKLAPIIDGVVAAYPKDRQAIERALEFLNDQYTVAPHFAITYPWYTPSQAGDAGLVSQQAVVTDAERAAIQFHYGDDYDGPTTGYHFAQLRVNDRVLWEDDVAGHDDAEHVVDLSKAVADQRQITLSFGVFDKKGVSSFGVHARFSDVKVTGLKMEKGDTASGDAWSESLRGRFTVRFEPGRSGRGRHRLPLIVMPAGSRSAYEKRNNEKATSERIAGKVRMVLELAAQGKVQGVVTYCLDKRTNSKDFDAVRDVFKAFVPPGCPRKRQ